MPFTRHTTNHFQQLREFEIIEAFSRLKQQDKILLAALAVWDTDTALHFIRNGLAEDLQVTYSILDREQALPILEESYQWGVELISRLSFARRILTGKFRPG